MNIARPNLPSTLENLSEHFRSFPVEALNSYEFIDAKTGHTCVVRTAYNEISSISWYDDCGRPHKDDGPAHLAWFLDGQVYKVIFYKFGKLHNPDASAFKEWHTNGKLASEIYVTDGVVHRDALEGPASATYDSRGRLIKMQFIENDLVVNGIGMMARLVKRASVGFLTDRLQVLGPGLLKKLTNRLDSKSAVKKKLERFIADED